MRSPSSLHRPVAVLATAVLAAGLAGCGGSDDGGGGGSGDSSYASTWNEVCTSLSSAQTTLQKDGVAVQKSVTSPNEATLAKAFAKPVSKFADTMAGALERVKDLDAPDDFKDFQSQVAKSAPSTITVLKDVQAPLAKGDVDAVQSIFKRIDANNLFPAIPAELKKQASACSVF
jgi:hypothetical protein